MTECGAFVECYWKGKATSPRDPRRTATSPTINSTWNGLLSNLAFLRPATNCLISYTVISYLWTQILWSIWSCLFFCETWSVALKGGVTLKALEKKVLEKMFVSKRNEGKGENFVMKRFMICTHQLIFQITYGIESNLTICLSLALIWAKWIQFTRAHHCNLSWVG